MRTLLVFLLTVTLATSGYAAETKTDLGREVFVEESVTDFVLTMKPSLDKRSRVYTMRLSAPFKNTTTLVCFVDGKLWQHMQFQMPGTYRLNLRGLKPGKHRVTIQAVTTDARVGRATSQVEVRSQ